MLPQNGAGILTFIRVIAKTYADTLDTESLQKKY